MDLGSPIGMLICLGAVVFGIVFLGGDVGNFIDPASIALTIVPTLFALIIAFPINEVLTMTKHLGIILGRQKYDPIQYVTMIISMAETARSNGLMSLESRASEIEDEYVKTAAQMVADATDTEVIEERLHGILDSMTERHSRAWALYDKGAAFAPAFGMVATVVSLVNMLMGLDFSDAGGVASLGKNMSAAMITTFYGSLLANVFFLPLGNKLRVYHQKELSCKKLVIYGFLAIQKGTNPRNVRDMLVERLDPKVAAKLPGEGE